MEYDVDCDADIILGYDWPRAHDSAFLCHSDAVSGCSSSSALPTTTVNKLIRPGFSALAAPLTALCSPRAQFTWGPAEQQSFDALKAALTSAPVQRVRG